MAFTFRYQRISSYRELPPRWKIVEDERASLPPADRYLLGVDEDLQATERSVSSGRYSATAGPPDLLSLVFANQALGHQVTSRQLAGLIEERRALAQKHLADIQWRLDELLERRPIRLSYGRSSPQQDRQGNDLERQILDLERQKRDVELALWKDTLELRQSLVTDRQELAQTMRRNRYLIQGYGANGPRGSDVAA